MEKIKILELFGGVGAPRKALENLGIDIKCIDYVEIEQAPVNIYNSIYCNDKSIESVVGYNLKPDILIHGSPCQDFSIAGKGLGGYVGSGTRSSLMWETIRIVKEMNEWKPKVIIWENVKGVLNKNNIDNFNKYINALNDLGYKSTYKVLNAKDFGIPQNRERIFTISILNGSGYTFDFDNLKTKDMLRLNNFLDVDVDKSYYIKAKSMTKAIEQGKIKIIDNVVNCITTKQLRWNNAGVIKIPFSSFNQENYTHITHLENKTVPTITVSGANSRIKIFVPKKYDDVPVFKIDNEYYHLRLLTEKECWLLMGFDEKDYENIKDNFSKTQIYKASGNSIVVDVLESIFIELLKVGGGVYLNNRPLLESRKEKYKTMF